MFIPRPEANAVLTGSILILPSLSLGNVGQLAVDAMVVTLNAISVGYLEEESVLPAVGNDAFTPPSTGLISTSLEIYYKPSDGSSPAITFLQQRAPVIKGHNEEFVVHLMDFIKQQQFSHVVLLHSSDASRRIDSQISGPQIRSIVAGSDGMTETRAQRLKEANVIPMEKETLELGLKHGTVAQKLHDKFVEASSSLSSSPTLTVLVHFVHEGYNLPEGISMATFTSRFLQLFPETVSTATAASSSSSSLSESQPQAKGIQWVIPSSWKNVIQSPPFDKRLFG